MTTNTSGSLFTDLTEDETAQLNGGRRCYYVRVRRWFRYGYRYYIRTVWAIRCY